MIGFSNGIQAYRVVEETKEYSGVEIVVMLYQGIIDFLSKSINYIDENNKIEKTKFINKSIRIINEGLVPYLDFENGGEIAINLSNLYSYSIKNLIEADLHNDKNKIEEVINLFRTVKEGWDGIKEQNKAVASMS